MNKNLSFKLDVVRGYAALAVLLAHVNQWFVLPLTGISTFGRYFWNTVSHYAVLVFFLLSGFVIVNSLLTNLSRNGQINEVAFLKARSLRILPPFVVAMVLSILVALAIQFFHLHGAVSFKTAQDLWVSRDNVALNARDVLATSLLSNGMIPGTAAIITNGPLWSLSYEVWLYGIALLGAVAFETIPRKSRRNIARVALVGLALLLSGNILFLEYGVYWALGGVLSLGTHFRERFRFLPAVLALLAIPGLAACLHSPSRFLPLNHGALSLPINITFLILFTGVFRLSRDMKFGVIDRAGALLSHSSYTLYILHFPILLLLFSFFHLRFLEWGFVGRAMFLCAITGFIVVLADLLGRIVENRNLWRSLLMPANARRRFPLSLVRQLSRPSHPPQ